MYFFQYVLAIVGMSILFVYLSVRFVVKDYGPTGAHSVVFSVLRWLVCRPWVSFHPALPHTDPSGPWCLNQFALFSFFCCSRLAASSLATPDWIYGGRRAHSLPSGCLGYMLSLSQGVLWLALCVPCCTWTQSRVMSMDSRYMHGRRLGDVGGG